MTSGTPRLPFSIVYMYQFCYLFLDCGHSWQESVARSFEVIVKPSRVSNWLAITSFPVPKTGCVKVCVFDDVTHVFMYNTSMFLICSVFYSVEYWHSKVQAYFQASCGNLGSADGRRDVFEWLRARNREGLADERRKTHQGATRSSRSHHLHQVRPLAHHHCQQRWLRTCLVITGWPRSMSVGAASSQVRTRASYFNAILN